MEYTMNNDEAENNSNPYQTLAILDTNDMVIDEYLRYNPV